MTARQVQLRARDVAIYSARRAGLTVPILAIAYGLSERRIKAIVSVMRDPERFRTTLHEILDWLEKQASRAAPKPKRITPRGAAL